MKRFFRTTRWSVPAAAALYGTLAAAQPLIGQIQGSGHWSPLVFSGANPNVAGVLGIVTAVDGNGFWFQDGGDGNALSSDAVYVFRGSGGSKPLVGDRVAVTGQVQEFRPGGSGGLANLTTTQINATAGFSGAFSVLSSGNALPAARIVDAAFQPPTRIAAGTNVETAGYTLAPSLYAMDFYEHLEGMRITLPSARASGPRNGFGEIAVVAAGQTGGIVSPRGGVVLGPGQFNGQRWFVDDRIVATPSVNSGATLTGLTGVLDYSFANYKLYLTQPAGSVIDTLARESASIAPGRFGVASYNLENLGGNAAAARFSGIADQIAGPLGAPHLLSLQEVQDNNGATNNGVVAADLTLNTLAAALNTRTGRSYQWVSVNPVNNSDGGEPGGNIRQAFMYDSSRVSFAGVVGGALDAVTAVAGAGGQIVLNLGAGRVDPANAAWANSRKPLVSEFAVDGQQVIVIANHFNSKGGDQPLFGVNQPPVNDSEVQRRAQAEVLGSFVAGLLAINPHANIIVSGDFNDFQFAGTLAPLTAAGLVNLTDTLPEGERYTYAFEGNLQALDHMFVSRNLFDKAGLAYDVVHVNAEFLTQVSDHDPILLTLGGVPAPVPEPAALALLLAGLAVVARRARKTHR
jgi:predicted extracellular nuclease